VQTVTPIVKETGRNFTRGAIAPVIKSVEMINYHLILVSTVSIVTLVKLVAKNEVTKETKIPTEVIMSGK